MKSFDGQIWQCNTENSIDFKHKRALVVLFKHINALTEGRCAYWPYAYRKRVYEFCKRHCNLKTNTVCFLKCYYYKLIFKKKR